MKQYVRAAGKENFTEDDYVSLYRANPDRSDSPYYYRIDVVKALQVIDRVSDSPDTREEYTKTAMLLAQTDNPDDPRVKKIVRKRITSPCSKQKEKPAQSELAKGFTAVLPGGG